MTADGLVAGASLATATGVVLFAVARARARAIEASTGDQHAHELRVCLRRMSPVAAACGCGSAGLCVTLTHWPGIRDGRAAVTILAAGACIAFPVVAARLPVMAAYGRVRGVPARAFRSYRQLAALAIRLVLTLWPIAAALTIRSGLAADAGILLVGYLVIDPVLNGLLAPVLARILGADAVSDELRARLSGMAAEVGVRIRGRVIRARARKVANAMHVGWLPGLCYVVITDYLLDELTPSEIDAVLAHELGHSRISDGLLRILLICTSLLPPGLLLAGLRDHGPAAYMACMYALCIAYVIGFRRLYGSLAIRWELKADDLAARIIEPSVLAAALTHLTELNAIKRDTSRSWDRTVGHPGMAARITRLQTAPARAAAD